MTDGLPEGWAAATVGTCIEFRYGKGLPEKMRRPGIVDVYGSNGIVGAHEKPLTLGPTIVIGRKGSVGEVHLSKTPCWPIDTTYFVDSFGPFEPRVLTHLLRHLDLSQQETSTAIPGLNRDDAYGREILIPPLAEQHRIVEKVEALLEQVHRAKARLERVPLILKRFRRSVLAAACSGQLSTSGRDEHSETADALLVRLKAPQLAAGDTSEIVLPRSWRWAVAQSLCDPTRAITYGVIKLGDPVQHGVPTLRSSDVRPLYIEESGIKRISPLIANQYGRTVLRGGEVLVTVRGTLGGVAVVPDRMKGFNISREVAQLPLVSDVNPHFVALSIASIATRNWLTDRARGAAYTGINIEDLRLLPIPVPPRREQDQIVSAVMTLFAIADSIERRTRACLAKVETLPESILSVAFAGELVPTEAELARVERRTYETAEILLARVRAGHEDDATKTMDRGSSPKQRKRRSTAAA